MKAASLVVLILSGLSAVFTIINKEFHYVNTLMTWAEARTYCKKMFTDPAAVSDKAEMDRLMSVLPKTGDHAWIGLRDDLTRWFWIVENAKLNYSGFTNWNPDEPVTKKDTYSCGVMTPDGFWHSSLCWQVRPSVCFSDQEPSKYIFVETEMEWGNALSNCRTKYTDLATVKNISENEEISSLLSIKTWIGLRRKHWALWSNQKPTSYFNWDIGQPDSKGSTVAPCAVVNTTTGKWSDADCATMHPFVCHKIIVQDKTTFKLKFQSEANLSDPAIQQQIIEQLHAKLDQPRAQLKLSWRQKDGKTFHKQQKKKTEDGLHC